MNLSVCVGSSCHLKGSREVIELLQRMISENGVSGQIDLRGTFCMNHCQTGVSVLLDGEYYSVTPETAELFFIQYILSRLGSSAGNNSDQV